ncbi:MAG: beta-lactamase family protein [Deltaproteobacteria bacterium]|nr:beta-lactamase family protein [Deltaproteobacteria bacterium]
MKDALRYASVLVLVVLSACGAPEQRPLTPPPPPPVPAPSALPPASASAAPTKTAPEKLADNSPRTTAAGTTFTAPGGWTIESDGNRTILTGPEPDLRIAIVESAIKSADEAVAAAWPALRPDFKRPLKLMTPLPGRRGWDLRRDYDYETSPNEKLVVFAVALRHDDKWLTLVVESGQASFEKRVASLRLVRDSLRPKGYTKETFAGKKAQELDAAKIKQLTDFVDQGRKALSLPGVAISVLQGGKVAFEGGFGERELGKPAKVDADTLFMIASNTKALATLLLAKEVDEGKFTWETPVTSVYPSFKLGSAETTSKVLMKHLVCACTGLPRQDMEWLFEYDKASPKSAMELLGTMEPTTKFGESFQYSNLMASAAGFIGGHVAYPKMELGDAFDEAMKKKIFEPLKMKSTTFDFARALAGNHASPHGEGADGKMAVARMDINRSIIPARPAGGAWSSARELARYVQMEIDKGKLADGKSLLSAPCLLARRDPQVSLGENKSYGMGLMVDAEYGVTVVHHGGDMIGYHSDMFWLPEHGVGGVILTNGDGGWLLRKPFVRRVLELLFDGKPEAMEDTLAAAMTRSAEIAKVRERLVVPPAAEASARLAGHYKSKALGEIVVRGTGAERVFDLGEWKSAVGSRKNDDGTTSMITVDPGVGAEGGFEFVLAEKNGKRALILRDMQHEYEFTEVP